MKTSNEQNHPKSNSSEIDSESTDLLGELDKIARQYDGKATTPEKKDDSGLTLKKLHFEPVEKSALSVEELQHAHLKFHLTGIKDKKSSGTVSVKNLIPALSAPYTDLRSMRYDFPLVIRSSSDKWSEPLSNFIDSQIADSGFDKDSQGQLRRILLKLEVLIKKYSESKTKTEFKKAWDQALKALLKENNSHASQSDPIKEKLLSIKESLSESDKIISYTPGADLALISEARLFSWKNKTASSVAELEELIQKLKNILNSASKHSKDAYSINALKDTMGKTGQEEVDFESLSEIVSTSFSDQSLSETRTNRIKDTIEKLKRWYKIISVSENTEKFLEKLIADSTQKALKLYQKEKEDLIDYFKAVRIARLEIEHRYEEEKHDPFFAAFSSLYLSDDDWSYFPPILLYFKASEIKSADKSDLMDVLSSKMPIKILLTLDDLYQSSAVFDEYFYAPGWSTVLGKMVLSLNNPFIIQAPLSNVANMLEEFEKGIEFNGPALFSLFDGFDQNKGHLPPFVRSASASESRALGIFSFDPEKGKTWAEKFSINKSPQFMEAWPSGEITVADGEKEEKLTLEYSLADFLYNIYRYGSHYLPVSRAEWHPQMAALTEYLQISPEVQGSKVPYIVMADRNGEIKRVIVTKTMCKLCINAQTRWKSLQETGGINNSHVNKQLEIERQKLQNELKAEKEALQAKYNAEMERSVSELTNEIISNIASGLLSDEMISIGSGAAPVQTENKKTAAPVAQDKPEQKEEVEEVNAAPPQEDEMAFNEPYIDTPLCTSCNDCRNVNSQMFAYDENKQAYIKDAKAGTFKDLVTAAEKCPVKIIHPGKPLNPDEPGLDELVKQAEKYN